MRPGLILLSLVALLGVVWWVVGGRVPAAGLASSAPAPADGIAVPLASGGLADELAAVQTLLESGDAAGARERATALAERAEAAPGALIVLTDACIALGDLEGAVEAGRRAAEAAPASSEAHFARARGLRATMMAGGMLAAVTRIGPYRAAMKRTLELDPQNVAARMEEIGFLMVAPAIAGGDKEEAREQALALVEIDARMGKLMLAQVQDAAGDTELALETLEGAREEFPDDGHLWTSTGQILQRHERWDEALDAFDRTLALEVSDEPYWQAVYQKGRTVLLAEGDAVEAIPLFEAYLAADPFGRWLPPKAGAWWRLGMAREKSGDREGAREAFEEALRIDPDFGQARDSLAELERTAPDGE